MRAAWISAADNGRLRCGLCPHGCSIAEGKFGLCGVRGNSGGEAILPLAGRPSSLADDPIEKKPLYRFMPGTRVFSVGFYGCTMRCPFCQNWEISQTTSEFPPYLPPDALIAAARSSGCPSIAFTYSEPTVHFEYILEAATLARAAGLRTVLVTNGMLAQGPAEELLAAIDAVNLDIKCFSASAYRRSLGGDIEAVLNFARIAARNCWLEATTLVVPGLDDWEVAVAGIADFLAGLSPHIPFHLSAYHPAWKYDAPPTTVNQLERLRSIAAARLDAVYVGNVAGETAIDRCKACRAVLVDRRGYRVGKVGLVGLPEIHGSPLETPRARCASCGQAAFFVL